MCECCLYCLLFILLRFFGMLPLICKCNRVRIMLPTHHYILFRGGKAHKNLQGKAASTPNIWPTSCLCLFFVRFPIFHPLSTSFPPLWASHKNIFVNAVFASVTRDFIHVLLQTIAQSNCIKLWWDIIIFVFKKILYLLYEIEKIY